jgi:hypothetical protein
MGKSFDIFMAEKRQWNNADKEIYLVNLLAEAIETEKDVANERLLDTLVQVAKTEMLVSPSVYRALVARGEPGWLAAAGRQAVKDRSKLRRMEATRWLQYGRAGDDVSDQDLEAIKTYLTDKDDDVRSEAISAIGQFIQDAPDKVLPSATEWLKQINSTQRPFVVAAFAHAWGTPCAPLVYRVQAEWLRDAKRREPLVDALGWVITQQPLSLAAVEAGWDALLAPAIAHLVHGDWPRARPPLDAMLLYLMGTLLALRPAGSIIRRSEEQISVLLEAKDPTLPPTAIAMGPWRAFESYVTAVWPGYAEWWARQLERMSLASGEELWPDEMKLSREFLNTLRAAEPVCDIPPEQLDTFRRSALELVRNTQRS